MDELLALSLEVMKKIGYLNDVTQMNTVIADSDALSYVIVIADRYNDVDKKAMYRLTWFKQETKFVWEYMNNHNWVEHSLDGMTIDVACATFRKEHLDIFAQNIKFQ